MRFYCKIASKPNTISEEIRDGFKVAKRIKLCTFRDGVLDTEDKELIVKLQKRPDLFRTDRPWAKKPDWRITDKGKKLLEEGKRLGIDCRHIREQYLIQRINEIKNPVLRNAPEAPIQNKKKLVSSQPPKPQVKKIDYKELMRIAKSKGLKAQGVKKEVLRKQLKESGVLV